MVYELYLITHIFLAILSLSFAGVAGYQSMQRQVEKADTLLHTAWLVTLITVLSGVILSVATGKSILATCINLATFIVIIGTVHSYHVVRHKIFLS